MFESTGLKAGTLAVRRTHVKILIVEDEPKAGDYLRQGLREAGYSVARHIEVLIALLAEAQLLRRGGMA